MTTDEETPEERDTRTRAELDAAITAHAQDAMYGDGEVIIAWVAVAGVMRHDGGGPVITMPGPGEAIPFWQLRGLLTDAIVALDRQAERAERDGREDPDA